MYEIDNNSFRSAEGFNGRIRFLVMHYTTTDFNTSVKDLTGPSVSAHYLIPDYSNEEYTARFNDMRIFNLVDENKRAWHAGVSQWAGRNSLNDTSIGIEIVNLAKDNRGVFTFPAYHPTQIAAVIELAKGIIDCHPDITATNVVGHSDIALGRKRDPGPAFPWKELYAAGVGAWYEESIMQNYQAQFAQNLPSKADVITNLSRYGYDTSASSSESGYANLIRAFQSHFRPEKYDGVLDAETAAALYALIHKYFR